VVKLPVPAAKAKAAPPVSVTAVKPADRISAFCFSRATHTHQRKQNVLFSRVRLNAELPCLKFPESAQVLIEPIVLNMGTSLKLDRHSAIERTAITDVCPPAGHSQWLRRTLIEQPIAA
jgi:hypothetical protein